MSTTLVVLLLAVVLLATMTSFLRRRRALDARDAPQSDSQLPATPTAMRPEEQAPLDLADPEGVMLIPLPNGRNEALVLGSESALRFLTGRA